MPRGARGKGPMPRAGSAARHGRDWPRRREEAAEGSVGGQLPRLYTLLWQAGCRLSRRGDFVGDGCNNGVEVCSFFAFGFRRY